MIALAFPAPVSDVVQSAAEGRLTLFGDLSLADPEFLLLIPGAVLVTLWGRARAGRSRARMPILPGENPPRSLAQRLGWLPPTLQVAGMVALALALARPLRGAVETSSVSEGVDIALVVDRSSSMGYRDMEADRTRLDVVKDVVAEFARRRMTDREGAADYVGLFAFAKYPQELCPFTLDADAITGFLERLEIVSFKAEDGTGIGIALAKTVAVLRETDAESKVIVLLTDGVPNVWQSSQEEINDYVLENPNSDYYGSEYLWYNSVLMQTSMFEGDRGNLFGVGMGMGADYDFLDRVSRIANTDNNGLGPRGAGNPAEYEQRLTDIFEEIIKSPGSRLVQ